MMKLPTERAGVALEQQLHWQNVKTLKTNQHKMGCTRGEGPQRLRRLADRISPVEGVTEPVRRKILHVRFLILEAIFVLTQLLSLSRRHLSTI